MYVYISVYMYIYAEFTFVVCVYMVSEYMTTLHWATNKWDHV